MKLIYQLILAGILLAGASSLSAQTQMATTRFDTWIQTKTQPGLTNVLSANQVMEILTISMDSASIIEVIANGETIAFGQRQDRIYPTPFVIAGPATVILRRDSTGGSGSMMTYRITEKASQAPERRQR